MKHVARKPSKTAMRNKADRIFSAKIRARGFCEAGGFDGLACNGNLQTMHVVSRRYLSVRWDDDNAYCGCAAHHTYFTHYPLEFEQFCIGIMGPFAYDALKLRAREARGAPDYEAVLARLVAA